MRRTLPRIGPPLIALALSVGAPALTLAKVKVVSTLGEYAWAARAIGGDAVEVESLCPPDQDAHFLAPRPSFAIAVADADLFVDTGLDLELWAPVLLQKAGNARVMPGQPGYVSASAGVSLVGALSSADRSQGDVHVFGNPHIATSPLNMRVVVENIARGLERVDPAHAEVWRKGAAATVRDLDVRTFGAPLVDALGGNTLARLALKGKLDAFLATQQYQGKPLADRLGGWLGKMRPYRGRPIIAYHDNWPYLSNLLGIPVADTIETKPGVPPTPAHVAEVLERAERDHIRVILAASYYPKQRVEEVAKRAGATALVVPFHPGGGSTRTYPELVDVWIDGLAAALAGSEGAPTP